MKPRGRRERRGAEERRPVERAVAADPGIGRAATITTCAIAAACIVAALTFRIFDTDFWQHLLVGRVIWGQHAVPKLQIWCWPSYGEPYVLPSWGFRALLWPFWQTGGVLGLYAWRWLTTLAAFALLWQTARSLGARGLTTVLVLVVAALGYRQRSLVRPETLVAVLLAAQIWLLETRRAGGPDRTAWLIPIAWIWANAHISYYIGWLIVGVYALEASRRRTRAARMWLVLAGCIAVSFLNPFGARLLAQPIEFFLVGRHEPIYRWIGELQPLDWGLNDRNGLLVLLVLWPVLVLARARRKRFDPVEGVFLLLLTPAAVLSQRFTGFWLLVATPFLARGLGEWIAARRWPAWTSGSWNRAGAVAAACVVLTGIELTRADFVPGFGVLEISYPRAACDFIERNGIRGRSFNHWEFGGYLLWRFWPERDRLPFMDIHQTGTALDRLRYVQAQVDPRGWSELDRRHAFEWILLRRVHSPGDRLLDFIDADSAFAMVFMDDAAALYVRRRSPLAAVADSLGLEVVRGGEAWLASLDQRVRSNPDVRARMTGELERLLRVSPLNSTAHDLFATLLLMEGRRDEARMHLERAYAVNPRLADYHFRMGLIALDQGRHEEALRELESERRLGDNARIDLEIGSVHRRLGHLDQARDWYRRALHLEPDNQPARDSLSRLGSPG